MQQTGSSIQAVTPTPSMSPVGFGPLATAVDGRTRLVQVAAILVPSLYVIVVATAWLMNAPQGHDGILRDHHSGADDGPSGFVIGEIAAGGPAERAGLRPGDVVLAVNNALVTSEAFHQAVHDRRAGDSERLLVQRFSERPDASVEEVTVPLVSRLAVEPVAVDLVVTSIVTFLIVLVAAGVAMARPSQLAPRLLLLFSGSFAMMGLSDALHWGFPDAERALALDNVTVVFWLLGWTALFHLFLAFPTPLPPLMWLRGLTSRRGFGFLRHAGGGTALLYAAALGLPLALAAFTRELWVGASMVAPLLLLGSVAALVYLPLAVSGFDPLRLDT